jgi:copper homeostasis protein
MKKYKTEVCAGCIDSVKAAVEGGADRIELCDNLIEGGTTPSYGLIKQALTYDTIKVHVIIRPRSGDFLYTEEEMKIMREDILQCKKLGVDGVVIGCLTEDGEIDKKKTSELVELAKPMNVTFHRAFDMVTNAEKALEDVIETGCDRILTSGLKNSAVEGIPLLNGLVKQAGSRITILIGAGINKDNIQKLATETMASEFHFSGRSVFDGRMKFRKDGVAMGGSLETGEYGRKISDQNLIKEIVKNLNCIK